MSTSMPLDQTSYVPLPECTSDMVIDVRETLLNDRSAELMASAILQACIDAGQWISISDIDLGHTLERMPGYMKEVGFNVYNEGLSTLKRGGYVKIKWVMDEGHIVPQSSLSSITLNPPATINFLPEYATIREQERRDREQTALLRPQRKIESLKETLSIWQRLLAVLRL